jgi:ribA/ribD-fused uncharacterized protein
MIKEFQGEYRFLSNFWPCKVVLDGETYASVEHAFQAAKTRNAEVRKKIQAAKSPGEAKRMGRLVYLRDGWEEGKIGVMDYLIMHKFHDNPELGEKLFNTGNEELQEGNYWHDTFWGVDLNTGKGENHLGKILMNVRKTLSGK